MELRLSNLRSSSGMGLVEIVIAVGILTVIMLGVGNMIINSQKGAQSVQKRLDAGQVGSFVSTILANPIACNNSGIVGQVAPAAKLATTPDTVMDKVPTLNFAGLKFDENANSLFDNGQVKIQSLRYHSVKIIGSVEEVDIRMQVSAQGANTQDNIVGGNILAPIDFPVIFNVTGGNISSCGPAACDQFVNVGPGSGYSKTCSGLITQWISVVAGGGSGSDRTFSYPIPFPNNVFAVTVGSNSPPGDAADSVRSFSNTQFIVDTNRGSDPVTVIAIGN